MPRTPFDRSTSRPANDGALKGIGRAARTLRRRLRSRDTG
jgi:hypothetical protein